jgi:integrase
VTSAPDQQILAMLALCPKTLIGARDRTILALGFAGAFRHSELAALTVKDLNFQRNGHVICHITRSKTDQAGAYTHMVRDSRHQ